jgi:hypothetical protein
MTTQTFAFEDFPRKPLTFPSSRRQLFTDTIMQLRVIEGQSRGGVGHQLGKLGCLPDAELAPYVPLMRADCQISMTDDFIWGRLPDEAQPIRLFPREQATLCAFNSMNGRTTLRTIGNRMAMEMNWDPKRGFAFARGLFLHLVQLRVCMIADPGAP